MTEHGSMGRSLMIGAVIGVLVVGVALAAVLLGSTDLIGGSEPPEDVLVIAVTKDMDGASVAGVAFVVGSTGTPVSVDTNAQVTIPGTTYDRLRDAYSFGGGSAVLAAYSEVTGEDVGAWVVLPSTMWIAIVDDAGGIDVDVPAATNVFADDELYSLEAGHGVLSGDELAALAVAGSDPEWMSAKVTGLAVTEALAEVVTSSWGLVVDGVAGGEASSSENPDKLQEFGTQVGL